METENIRFKLLPQAPRCGSHSADECRNNHCSGKLGDANGPVAAPATVLLDKRFSRQVQGVYPQRR